MNSLERYMSLFCWSIDICVKNSYFYIEKQLQTKKEYNNGLFP